MPSSKNPYWHEQRLTFRLRKAKRSSTPQKFSLSKFLAHQYGLQRETGVQEIMSRFPANYIIYESGRHEWQLCRGNLVYFLDRRGLYRIEITNSLRPLSDAVDWEGLVFPDEVTFLNWCNQHSLEGLETFREQDEDGVAYVLQYPSGADVLISNGEIRRLAKNYLVE